MTNRFRIVLALLLAGIFLLAQFHLCVDAGRLGTSAHACHICASGAWAIASPGPQIAVAVAAQPLETIATAPLVDPGFARARPPRAPPAA